MINRDPYLSNQIRVQLNSSQLLLVEIFSKLSINSFILLFSNAGDMTLKRLSKVSNDLSSKAIAFSNPYKLVISWATKLSHSNSLTSTKTTLQPLSDTSTITFLPSSSNSSLAELVVVDSFVSLTLELKISQASNPQPTSAIAFDNSVDENLIDIPTSSLDRELVHRGKREWERKIEIGELFIYLDSPAGQSVSISSPDSYIDIATA